MPIVGKEWAHKGVVKFYNDIVKNGYKILYLTARAIGYIFEIVNLNKPEVL